MSNNALTIAAKSLGATILPDNAAWRNRIEIKSETSNSLYTVAERKSDGVVGCSCRGWIRHKHCKHVDAFSRVMIAAERQAKGSIK